jgi:cell division protein FtsQ
MKMNKSYTIKNILLTTIWVAIGVGTVVLLVSAIQKKDEQRCKGVYVNITGVSNNFFVDKLDVLQTIELTVGGKPEGKAIGTFNLKRIENELQKNIWVKNAQLFFDNNELLQVNVLEREPVVRVFTASGNTFYLDSSRAMLPLSDKFSARLPVFTNFPSDKKVLLKADSNLLREILTVGTAIHADSFMMAMIDQVDITPQRSFELVPKIGNTIIVFGDAANVEEKFYKLHKFYKDVMVKAGWNKYSVVDVQYKNQVVARRKEAKEVAADSMRTLQLMKIIAENAERMSADTLQVIVPDNERNTTNSNLIQASIERDDDNASSNTIEEPQPQGPAESKTSPPVPIKAPAPKPVAGKPMIKPAAEKKELVKTPVKNLKAAESKKILPGKTPKAVMPKKQTKPAVVKPQNDY